MAREVEGVGEAPAKEPVDTLPLDLGRPKRVAVGCVVDGKCREGRTYKDVVVIEHVLQRIEHLGPDHIVPAIVQRGLRPAQIQAGRELR